jgi:hypothetical protein
MAAAPTDKLTALAGLIDVGTAAKLVQNNKTLVSEVKTAMKPELDKLAELVTELSVEIKQMREQIEIAMSQGGNAQTNKLRRITAPEAAIEAPANASAEALAPVGAAPAKASKTKKATAQAAAPVAAQAAAPVAAQVAAPVAAQVAAPAAAQVAAPAAAQVAAPAAGGAEKQENIRTWFRADFVKNPAAWNEGSPAADSPAVRQEYAASTKSKNAENSPDYMKGLAWFIWDKKMTAAQKLAATTRRSSQTEAPPPKKQLTEDDD